LFVVIVIPEIDKNHNRLWREYVIELKVKCADQQAEVIKGSFPVLPVPINQESVLKFKVNVVKHVVFQ
jgi:hypothetical protein